MLSSIVYMRIGHLGLFEDDKIISDSVNKPRKVSVSILIEVAKRWR